MMLPAASVWGTWAGIATLVLWFLWTGYSAAADEVLIGRASVIDGDTIEVQGKRVRLHGVDAPEAAQRCDVDGHPWRCGQHAALELASWLGTTTVVCRRKAPDSYDRMVAACMKGVYDLGAWLVENGWAVAATKYSQSYVDEQERARQKKAGIWQSRFDMPWEYRGGARRESAQ